MQPLPKVQQFGARQISASRLADNGRWQRQQRLIAGDGIRLERTLEGVRINSTATGTTGSGRSSAQLFPFKVKWQILNEKSGDGEWQIYLPRGCATVEQLNVTQAYIPTNSVGKDIKGDDELRWYSIPKPEDTDAEAGTSGDYAAKIWTVYVHFKPWPRMKVSTAASDSDFGEDKWTIAVAQIAEMEIEEEPTVHSVTQMISIAQSFEWDASGTFAIKYEMENETAPDSAVKVYLVNQYRLIGRLAKEEIEPKEITDWKKVWVKYEHKETEVTYSVEKDLTDTAAVSNDDQTVYKLYNLKNNVVQNDLRSSVPEMSFYTSAASESE